MSDLSTDELKHSVESQLGGTATYVRSVLVNECPPQRTVAIFDLADHLTADRAYAWSDELGNGMRRLIAVLHARPVASPSDAVKAAVAARMPFD